uniref:Zinc finger CCCH domain-containing protein 17 n=1 Tax=Cajanus cajan TaxID=3821 RepID=A0A151S8Q8_CAJCA|nr:Zinc finger CCCH domain-containing protein 17 [Cajanus cajan]
MDEDSLKRSTDCVYFLASPLTCKKGAECEYRHNEIARLNPRDCWYWLSGQCLNPTCAFRHPFTALLIYRENLFYLFFTPPLPLLYLISILFYFLLFDCNLTHWMVILECQCHLNLRQLHYLQTRQWFPVIFSSMDFAIKNDNGSTNALNLENKTSSGNRTGTASIPIDQSLTAPKNLSDSKLQPKENLQLQLPKNVKQQGNCVELSALEYKEAAVSRSDSPFPDDGFVHNVSHLCTEQSSEEQVNSHIEPEERWESSPHSPGFDVLVHDELENMGYEEDSEYLPVLDRDEQELNEQYLGYEFKEPVEYDTMCPEADILYEQETYDGYRCLDRDLTHANGRAVHAYSRDIFLDSLLSRKRIRMSAEMAAYDQKLDLRDHLRRRREINGPPVTGFLRQESPSLMVRNQERHQRHDIEQRPSRRLTSQLGYNAIDSIGEVENLSIANKHKLFRPSQQNRPRKHYREKLTKRPFLSSKISRKPVLRQRGFIHDETWQNMQQLNYEIKVTNDFKRLIFLPEIKDKFE